MIQNTPQALEKMCKTLLCIIQVPFQVRERPKIPFFGVKMDHDGGLPYPPKNPPGNWKMWQNTPVGMEKHGLDTFMHHPGVIPGDGASKKGLWGVKNSQNGGMP